MIEIDNEKFNEAVFLIKKVSNELNIFIRMNIEIECYGEEEVDDDSIYKDGELKLTFDLYIGMTTDPYSGWHYDFDSLDEVIKKIKSFQKKQRLARDRPLSKMMQAQDAIGERDAIEKGKQSKSY